MMALLVLVLTIAVYGLALGALYWGVNNYVKVEPLHQILVGIIVLAAVVVVFFALFGDLPVPSIIAKIVRP